VRALQRFEVVVIQHEDGRQGRSGRLARVAGLRSVIYPALYLRRRWQRWRSASALQAWANLSNTLAEDPIVAVANFSGNFAIGARSDILRRLMLTGCYEPELVEICRKYVDPHRDVIDVGANVGLYTVLFASLAPAQRILAIEPTPAALARLRRNLAINGVIERVEVYAGAASGTESPVQMRVVTGREEYSTAGELAHPSVSGAAFETLAVPARTVDALVRERRLDPGFVKIDVEGTEHTVLAGLLATIAEFRPVILAELSDPLLKRNGSSAREVMEVIRRQGYELTDPLVPGAPPGARPFGDLLCVPSGWKE
jgi:FkbM family methyltransferase